MDVIRVTDDFRQKMRRFDIFYRDIAGVAVNVDFQDAVRVPFEDSVGTGVRMFKRSFVHGSLQKYVGA